ADLLADGRELQPADSDHAVLLLCREQPDRDGGIGWPRAAVRHSGCLRGILDAHFLAGRPDARRADGAGHAVPAALVRDVPAGRPDRLLYGADPEPCRHHAADRNLGVAAVV